MTFPEPAWRIAALLASILAATGLTLGCYWAGVRVYRKLGRIPVANPVLIAILMVAAVLLFLHIDYSRYFAGAQVIHLMLGPATVALAVPLASGLKRYRKSLIGALPAIAVGAFVSAVLGLWTVRSLGGSEAVARSMAPKAATTPIAIGIARGTGGEVSLTATFAILAGILVAISVEHVLRWAGVTDKRAIGIAAGTAGSGIGTARAFQLDELAGAFAGLAIGLTGLATALLVPMLVALFP